MFFSQAILKLTKTNSVSLYLLKLGQVKPKTTNSVFLYLLQLNQYVSIFFT